MPSRRFSRSRWVLVSLFLATLLAVGCSVHTATGSAAQAGKILVCHKGKKTLEIAEAALEAHLGHGDYRGPCH